MSIFVVTAAAVVGVALGIVIGARFMSNMYKKHCEYVERNAERYVKMYGITIPWVKLHSNGKTLAEYFKKKGYNSAAVYGLGEVGYILLAELEKNDVQVKYCIDQNADNIFSNVTVFRPDADLPDVDVVIVTVVQAFDEIKRLLEKRLDCPIVSLEDVVWEA